MSDIQEIIDAYHHAEKQLQQDVAATHQKTFAPYKNAFAGKSAVIIGGGPTAQIFQQMEDVIYVGINDAPLKHPDITFDFVFATDYGSYFEIMEDITTIKNRFYGINLSFPPLYFPERFYTNAKKYYNFNMERTLEHMHFSLHMDTEILNTPSSTVFSAVLFLLYANVDKIYLVGFDCAAGVTAIQGQLRGQNSKFQYEAAITGWLGIKNFIENNHLSTEVVSVHPRGLKGVFTDFYQNESALLAVESADDGDIDSALEHTQKALEQWPHHQGCLDLHAKLLGKAQNTNFLPYIYAQLREHPHWYQGYMCLSDYFRDQGDAELQLYYLKKADSLAGKEITPANFLFKSHMAMQLYQAGRKDEFDTFIQTPRSRGFVAYVAFMLNKLTWYKPYDDTHFQIQKDSLNCAFNQQVSEDLQFRLRAHGHVAEAQRLCAQDMQRESETGYRPWRHLMFSEISNGNLSKALEYAQKMFLNAPLWVNAWRHYMDTLLLQKRHEDVLRLLDSLKDNLFHVDLSYYYSRAYAAKGEMETARAYAQKAVEAYNIYHHTELLPFIFHYAKLWRLAGKFEESEKLLRETYDRLPDQYAVVRELSVHFEEAGDLLQAMTWARKLHEITEFNGIFSPQYVKLLKKIYGVDTAIALLEKKIHEDPSFELGYLELCDCYRQKNDKQQAMAYIRQCLEMNKRSLKYMTRFLDIVQGISYVQATLYCLRFIQEYPECGYLYTRLSKLYEKQSNPLALDYACFGYELTPDDPYCFTGLVHAFMQAGMAPQALSLAHCQAKTHDVSPHILAEIYEGSDVSAADQYYVAACEACQYAVPAVVKRYMQFLDDNRDLSTKGTVLKTCLQKVPSWREGWNMLLESLQDPQDKLAQMQCCCDRNPSWADMHFNVAQALEQQDVTGVASDTKA